jgi:acyl carrier protein
VTRLPHSAPGERGETHHLDAGADSRARLRQFLARTFLLSDEEFPLADDESFRESGVVDSTGVLELITFVEEAFGIQIEDTEAVPQNLDTVANLVAFVARKQSKSTA